MINVVTTTCRGFSQKQLLSKICQCYNRDPAVTSLMRCIGLSKQEFYKLIRSLRSCYEMFFVPNFAYSNLVLVEAEEPNVDKEPKRTLIDLNTTRRSYFFLPIPSKDLNIISALEDVIKDLVGTKRISSYVVEAICCEGYCLRARKIHSKPSWGEVAVASILSEKLVLPKELATLLGPLATWQKATYLLRSVLNKGLVVGPVYRSRNRDLLVVHMDIKVEDNHILNLKGMSHWVEDTCMFLRKIGRYNREFSMIFSIKPSYMEHILSLNKLGALPYEIVKIRVYSGGTRIIPSIKDLITPYYRESPLETYAKALLPTSKKLDRVLRS